MQLQFTRDELALLAEILERQAATRTDRLKGASYALLDHVIRHDLGLAFDELEDLQDLLMSCKTELLQQVASASPQLKTQLELREKLLQKITDKVTEACAMV